MLYDVNTLLKKHVKAPEIKPINRARTKKPAQDPSNSNNGVWMGDTLTATAVHQDTTVLTQVPGNVHRYGVANIVELPS